MAPSQTVDRGEWIQTFTGVAFHPLDPTPEDIRIEDIAHALSMQCRFTGHVKQFYSVAEHSVRVSNACDPSDALCGLLHDASEAYLVDVARPIKHGLPAMSAYREIEHMVQRAICKRFGILIVEPESVKYADKVMLAVEARDLMSPLLPGWEEWASFLHGRSERIEQTWEPSRAKSEFMARFRQLFMRDGV